MAAVSRLLLKRRDSWVANQRLMVLMDNGRTPGLQISWPGFRGSCTMYFMESRQKEDEEVSSQATTLQFGSPGKSRWEEYVCLGYPHCENFDCDLCDNPSETEVEDAKADERNTAPPGSALYLQNEVRAYHLRRERKEANNAKLGKGKGRSGGRAAPKKVRKAKEKEKGKEEEPCTCVNCMSERRFNLYIKAKGKETAKDKERGKGNKKGNRKNEVKRDAVEETIARNETCVEFARRAYLARTDSLTSSLHEDVGVQCTMPKDRASYKGKGKDAHELKSCDKGTQMSSQCIPRNRPIYH